MLPFAVVTVEVKPWVLDYWPVKTKQCEIKSKKKCTKCKKNNFQIHKIFKIQLGSKSKKNAKRP